MTKNVFPKSLTSFTDFKESYLCSLEPAIFSYFDNIIQNSFFLSLTQYSGGRDYTVLDNYDFDKFDYIFLLDILDPPHYHVDVGKWEDMKSRFNSYLDKTFVVSSLYENPYFKTIHFDSFLHFVPKHFKEIKCTRNFTKKYLSYNGRPHLHRKALLNALQKNNLLKDGFVTGSNELTLDDGIPQKDLNNFNNQITTNPYYYSTPVNIVTETSISDQCVFITEKTIKAIASKQMIMHIGNPRSFQYLTKVYGLKNYGFDFEPKIADHSFQDKIKFYCDFLKETTLDDLSSIYKDKEDILEFNKNKVFKDFKEISFNLFLTSIKKHHIINL